MHIALDTEFVWQRSYYANLGLIQAAMSDDFDRTRLPSEPPAIFDFPVKHEQQKSTLLIDPLNCNPSMMNALISDPSVTKILHDAVQDLQHIHHWCGALPVNIFDTRLAAGFCGMPSILSLRQLLINTQGIELTKTETRTDWMRRPLSPEQLEYAADDVAYLGAVMDLLLAKARELGTYAWMTEELAKLDSPALYVEDSTRNAWKRIKVPVTAFTKPRQLIRLRELAAWREETARMKNLPRSWVVEDKLIIDASINPPPSPDKVPKQELPHAFSKGFFETLQLAEELPEDDVPELRPVASTKLRDTATTVLKALAVEAEKVHVDPALFGSRAEVTYYCQNPENPDHALNNGWRHDILGDRLRTLLPASSEPLL